IEIEALVADVDHANIASLLSGVDMILDGTDNFETRFLLNDAALKFGIPWVYGGCIGCDGQTMTILPGQTPCLRCLMPAGPRQPHGHSLRPQRRAAFLSRPRVALARRSRRETPRCRHGDAEPLSFATLGWRLSPDSLSRRPGHHRRH